MKSKQTYVLLVVVFVLVNALLLWFRYGRSGPAWNAHGARIAALQEKQAKQVLAWDSMESLPPEAFVEELKTLTTKALRTKCGGLEEFGEGPVELSPEEEADLAVAVGGFVEAYADGTPNALVDYMRNRGETLRPVYVAILREVLEKEMGIPSEEVGAATTDLAVLELLEKTQGKRYNWVGILPSEFCIHAWKSGAMLGANEKTTALGGSYTGLFGRQARYSHTFGGPDGCEWDFGKEGPYLFADVKLVVEHGASRFSERSPYYVRLCYDQKDTRWHPFDFVHVTTICDESPDFMF